jgi:DNA-binding CsgD family transcriptional regulator
MSNQQIADQMGLSVKTVEAQITIALKRLRDTLLLLFLAVFSVWELFQ